MSFSFLGKKDKMNRFVPQCCESKEMNEKIRTAIIGLGKMGILHSALINTIAQSDLVAVCDTNKKLARYVERAGLNVNFYTDPDRLLDEAEPGAVFICTPPFTHLPLTKKCVEHNCDIFVEKPLAESFESAQKMAALAEKKGIVHSTGFTLAFVPIYCRAKELLDCGTLGRIFRFNASIYISQVFSKKKGWFFDKRRSGGGVMIDIASHVLYLLTAYFGSPTHVYARLSHFFSDVEDSGSVVLDYEDGLTGVLDTSWSLPGYRTSATEVVIEGENGLMEICNDFIKLHLYSETPEICKGWTTLHKIDIGSQSHFELGGEGFADEDSHFFQCCLERKMPKVTWKEGLEVQRIIEAIYLSDNKKGLCSLSQIR
jgi:predicted dehydrogenase